MIDPHNHFGLHFSAATISALLDYLRIRVFNSLRVFQPTLEFVATFRGF